MKNLFVAVLALSSFSVFATDVDKESANTFSCLDKQTLQVDAKCISTTIEMSDEFVASQQAFYQDAAQPGDYVMATLLMDPVTLNITVIGHRDKSLSMARVESK